MQSIDQLFVYQLEDMLAAERKVASALDNLSQCQTDPQLQQIFDTHRAETENHIARLHQVFESIGEQTMPTASEGMIGLVREHDGFVNRNHPAPQIHAAFDAAAAQKVEQYEITAYEQLVEMASALGLQQATQLLQANLDEEYQQLQRLQNVSNTIDFSQLIAQPSQQARGPPQRQQPQQQSQQQPQQQQPQPQQSQQQTRGQMQQQRQPQQQQTGGQIQQTPTQ